jgi:hypothetical protein
MDQFKLLPARKAGRPISSAVAKVSFAVFFLAGAEPALATFKCVDDKGVTHYGDPLPPQCSTKAITELSKQGTVKAKIDRPLTPDEIKAKRDEEERLKDEKRKDAEQQRKDRALLATYGAEKEIDLLRDRAMEQVTARWNNADQRVKELDARIAKLDELLGNYKKSKNEPPAYMVQDLEQVKADKLMVQDSMKKMEDEKKTIAAQFDSDKQRWVALKTGKANLQAESKVVLPTRKAGERSTLICNGVEHTCRAGSMYTCRGVDSSGNPQVTLMPCK